MRLFAILLALLPAIVLAEDKPKAPVIIVDAGHGGAQEGAIGPDGILEKNVCLQIASRLAKLLEHDLGADVYLTREKDQVVSLASRVEFANKRNPDLFVSVHANSMPTRRQRQVTCGVETYFLSASATDDNARRTADRENAESARSLVPRGEDTLAFILADLVRSEAHTDSSRLAYSVHQKLVAGTGAQDRGVQQAPFYVLSVTAPAVLVEVGFVSHPDEGRKLADAQYQDVVARSIAEGVKEFLSQVGQRDHATAEQTPP